MNDQSAQTTQQPVAVPAEIRGFLEGLLNDAKMSSLDDSMREEMINELYVRLEQFLTGKIIDNLPPEKVEEFIKMNEDNKPQAEIQGYLQTNISNSEDVMTKAFMEFRNLYLGNVAVARTT